MKKPGKKIKRRILFFGGLCIIVIGLILSTMVNILLEIYNKKQEEVFLANQLEELNEEEEKIKIKLEKLKDPDYVARYAREKYLYSRDGEFILRIE